MSSYEHRSSVPEGSIVNCKYPGSVNARHVVGIVCADADSQSAVSRHAEPCAGRRFGRSHTNSMLTARRSSPVQCAIIRGRGARLTNEKDRGQDADRSGMIGKHRCRARGSPNFCARHAACIVRSSRNDALHAASGIRTYHCRSNICPSGTFRVGLTVSLAVLNVIDSDVETKVITTPSIFAVLSLTHLGCGGGMSRCDVLTKIAPAVDFAGIDIAKPLQALGQTLLSDSASLICSR